jgi:hypothetical protein
MPRQTDGEDVNAIRATSVEDELSFDLISQLRAPVSNSTQLNGAGNGQDDKELFGLNWIDGNGKDSLLLDVALEEDPSLSSAAENNFFRLFPENNNN